MICGIFSVFNFIPEFLGSVLYAIYNTIAFHNYGLAIILFTIIIKACLLPLTIKQLKSSAKMQELQPKLQELQKKYKNDREQLNKEMMSFYRENNFNPASGCLPILVQMPIIISLYYTISGPLSYMLGKSADQISKLTNIVKANKAVSNGMGSEIGIMKFFSENVDKLTGHEGLLKISEVIYMKFPFPKAGISLGETPVVDTTHLFGANALHYWLLLILPAIAVVTTYFSTKMSMPKVEPSSNKKKKQNRSASEQTSNQVMKMMLYVGPIMTLFISMTLPVGLSLYWAVSGLFQMGQQFLINKYKKKKELEKNNVATK